MRGHVGDKAIGNMLPSMFGERLGERMGKR